jgi:hypothetical protein
MDMKEGVNTCFSANRDKTTLKPEKQPCASVAIVLLLE